MLKIAISLHTASKLTMLGVITHFYEYGKHTATELLNSTKLNLSLVIWDRFIYCRLHVLTDVYSGPL